ncbi:MAG: sulfite exporter TauE/SafE family protein [Geminicoccaceae bacterium]|nr:sulfite exporter TauE/SafE family protein [Geminicoccaceae bacterium]
MRVPVATVSGRRLESIFPQAVGSATGWLLVAVSAFTSFVTAAFGIGGGVLLLAVMGLSMPPAALIPVHGVVQIGANAGRLVLMLRHVTLPVLLPFGIGGLLGAALGGRLVVALPAAVLDLALGCFVLYSVWGRFPRLAGPFAVAGTGAFSSFLTMFVGATGPFVAAMLKTMELDRRAHVATQAACMSLQHLLKVSTFGLLGFAYGDYAVLIALMIASGLLGTAIGTHLLERRSDTGFHRVLSVLLTVLALRLIYEGLAGLV